MPTRLSTLALRAALVALVTTAACYTDDDTAAPGVAHLVVDATPIALGVRDAATDVDRTDTITVTNSGTGATPVIHVSLGAGTTSGLVLATRPTGNCDQHSLAPGARCTVIVSLRGLGSGPQSGTVVIDAGAESADGVTIPVSGTIRSTFSIFYQGTGHGIVRAEPESLVKACLGAVGPNCSTAGAGAHCLATCGLSFESDSVTLVAEPDASSTFDGFTRGTDTPCVSATSDRCRVALIDLNSVGVRFTAK